MPIGAVQTFISTSNSLLVVGKALVDNLADTGVETLKLLELGRNVGGGRLGWEDAHEARQQTVDHAYHTHIGTVHARRNTALQRLETRQNHLLPLCNIHAMHIYLN